MGKLGQPSGPYDYDRRLLDAIQKVTPADVERKALEKRFGLKVLPKAEVFRDGYDEPEAEPAAEETP